MISGTAMVAASGFKSSIYTIHFGSLAISAFAGVFALALNLLVSIVLTLICDATGMKRLADNTSPEDYDEDAVALHAIGSGGTKHW
jgi:SSS family solute:Na+ symporter